MSDFYRRRNEAMAEEIKAIVEKTADWYDIELDKIKIYASEFNGTVSVYLEEGSTFNQGIIVSAVTRQFPDVEYDNTPIQ